MAIDELLEKTIQNNASDLHLLAGFPPILRIDGKLTPLNTYEPLTKEQTQELAISLLSDSQRDAFLNNKCIDFSFGFGGGNYGNKGRFRVNYYFQKGTIAAAFRLLPPTIRTIDELRLPNVCHTFASLKQGFVLVTGPTGHGKSTTLAAIINEINLSREANIITIEDPVEYIYPTAKSIISQRELQFDTHSWGESLRSALREDPDVVLIGEMRDAESMSSAITIAETGHLVFSTLHTNSAAQSIDRIIDAFPEHQQNQIRIQLSFTLAGIISQRLLPRIDGGRVVAAEVLIANNAIRSNIRDSKTHLIDSIIETSQEEGMIPLEMSLADLVKEGLITVETARGYTLREDLLMKLVS